MKPEWSNLSQFKFNPVFDLGIERKFLDPEYNQYIRCLDGIPDISVLLDDDNEDPTTSVCSATPEPPPKQSKLSLNRRGKSDCSSAAVAVSEPLKEKINIRFATPVTSPEREKAVKGVIPANTEASTRWAIKNFNTWALNCSAANPNDFVPPDLLKSYDAVLVCKWLC